jgi:DNA topoisomerase-1
MSLLIVESPAKCGKIRGFLGAGWTVVATMGHIRALEQDLKAVGLDRDFEPTYDFLTEKKKAIQGLRDAAKGIDPSRIFLAADDDREGEAIAFSVLVLLRLNPATTPRAVFHEITEAAVKAAVANPRRIDMNRVNAQQARAVLDMMVGYTISPLLWKYVAPSLSAGRCQTPALRLIADKESDIRDFQQDTVWRLRGSWQSGSLVFDGVLTEDLEDEESARNYLENIHGSEEGRILSATTRPTSEAPPKPLITSTLQQEASALFSSQPKNTMRIAQRLYEAGHITYMRTDSAVLSEEARLAAEGWVRTAFGEAYLASGGGGEGGGSAAPKPKASSKKKEAAGPPAAQEAHEAIRPTHVELVELPQGEDWNASDRKIYRLIWQRAVQSVMRPALGEQRTVEFLSVEDPNEFVWRATWKRQTFPGWKRIGAKAANLDEEEESAETTAEATWAAAAALTEASPLVWKHLEAQPNISRPPGRYTEATLVRELEKKGIGRPSTYASLVETILEKQYVEKKTIPAREIQLQRLSLARPGVWPPTVSTETKKVGAEANKLAPTPLGLSVLDFCLKEFETLFAYDFTSLMETRLDRIAEGQEAWKQVCRDTWGSYEAKYNTLKSAQGTIAPASARQRTFASGVKAVLGKKGPLLLREGATKEETVFYGWPEGVAFGDLTEEAANAFVAAKLSGVAAFGEFEGKPISKKSGPFGIYCVWNGINVPFVAEDTPDSIIAKLRAKTDSVLHSLGPFEFRSGQYGPFMYKRDLTGKARKFVGLPRDLDPKLLTVEAATRIFQEGLKQKAKGAAYKKNGGTKKE